MSEKRFVFKEVGDEYKVFDLSYNNEVAIANVRCHFDSVDVLVGVLNEQQATISALNEENEQLRRLFEEMKQPITINLTEEDEKELRKLLGLIDDE